MKKTRRFSFFGKQGLGKGLVVSDNPVISGADSMVEADNILIDSTLARKKRGGHASFHTGTFVGTASYPDNSGSTPIRGLHHFFRYDGAATPVEDLVLLQSNKFWHIDNRSVAAVNPTGGGLNSVDNKVSFQAMNDKIYWVSSDESEFMHSWDGSAGPIAQYNTAGTDVPLDATSGFGKYMSIYNNRLVVAGFSAFPYRVYLSKTFTPEDFNTGDATSLDLDFEGDPEGITGIYGGFNGALYVFTRRSIYQITGNTAATFQVKRITSGVGCLSHQTIQAVGNDVFFASDLGVHSLAATDKSQTVESTFVSRDIQRLWNELLNQNVMCENAQAVYDPSINSYVITAPSSGSAINNTLLVYNVIFGTWTKWPDINVRSLAQYYANNKPKVVTGGENGNIGFFDHEGQALRQDFKSTSGFTGRFKTGIIYPDGDISRKWQFKSLTIIASAQKQGSITITYSVDGIESGSRAIDLLQGTDKLGSTFVLGSSILGVGTFLPKTIPIDGIGYGLQLDFIIGGDSDAEVYGYIIEAQEAHDEFT